MFLKRFCALILALLLLVGTLTSCVPFNLFKYFFGDSDNGDSTSINEIVDGPIIEEEDLDEETIQLRKEFDEFLENDFLETVLEDTLSMHTYLKSPKDFGINEYEITWGDLNVYPLEENIAKDRATIEKLYSFDREKLSYEQKQSYDIYSYYCDIYDDSLDTLLLYDPMVGSNGYHAIMPFMMNEYTFYTEQDVKDYLELSSTFNQLFQYLVDWQNERSRLGLFMSDTAVDEIIDVCEGIIAEGNESIFVTGFNEKVHELSLPVETEKEYIKRNLEIFKDVIIPSYQMVIDGVKALKGTGLNKGGIAAYDNGKKYYATELKQMGLSRTPEEYISMCDKAIEESIDEFYSIYLKLSKNNNKDLFSEKITPKLSAEEIVNFMIDKCKDDFPSLPEGTTYSLKLINENLRDTLSAGFYFTPPFDDYMNSSIYYNPEYLDTDRDYLFFLMAHEGIPGHLLQQVTTLNSPLSNWRKIQSFRGYSEGWAQYVQYYSYGYFYNKDLSVENLIRLSEEIDIMTMTRMDLGVHYEGWSLAQFKEYVTTTIPYEMNDDAIKSYYDFIVDNPLNPIPYICGLLEIREMHSYFKENKGKSFSDKKFHTQLLRYGEAPYSLLRSWMNDSM